MSSNVSDNSQINTSILSTACSNPTAPTDLQRASNYSLDNNNDTSTSEFKLEPYAEVDWKRLFGYYLPHLTAGRRRGPTSLCVASFLGLFVYARLISQSRGSILYIAWC